MGCEAEDEEEATDADRDNVVDNGAAAIADALTRLAWVSGRVLSALALEVVRVCPGDETVAEDEEREGDGTVRWRPNLLLSGGTPVGATVVAPVAAPSVVRCALKGGAPS